MNKLIVYRDDPKDSTEGGDDTSSESQGSTYVEDGSSSTSSPEETYGERNG